MLQTITSDNTIVNWAALVRYMLFNLGFGYAWMQQGVTNRTYFISLFKQRLRDQYIQQWFTLVSTRSSCSIYKNVTNHFRCQNYFHMVTNCTHIISLIRFQNQESFTTKCNSRHTHKMVSPYCITVHALSVATLFYVSNMHLFIYILCMHKDCKSIPVNIEKYERGRFYLVLRTLT